MIGGDGRWWEVVIVNRKKKRGKPSKTALEELCNALADRLAAVRGLIEFTAMATVKEKVYEEA